MSARNLPETVADRTTTKRAPLGDARQLGKHLAPKVEREALPVGDGVHQPRAVGQQGHEILAIADCSGNATAAHCINAAVLMQSRRVCVRDGGGQLSPARLGSNDNEKIPLRACIPQLVARRCIARHLGQVGEGEAVAVRSRLKCFARLARCRRCGMVRHSKQQGC